MGVVGGGTTENGKRERMRTEGYSGRTADTWRRGAQPPESDCVRIIAPLSGTARGEICVCLKAH